MAKNEAAPGHGTWVLAFSIVLAVINVSAALFGGSMLLWALKEMHYKGEQWGLLGVGVLSILALAVMLLLLLPSTILVVVLARKRMRLAFRIFMVAALTAGVLMNAAALACIPLSDKVRKDELKKERIVYTSGLYEAVRNKDVAKAESILQRYPEAIGDYTLDRSLLAWAVDNDDQKMVELLLRHGADVNDGGGGQPSPLHFAARAGNIPIAEILLKGGADINAEDYVFQKKTPLVYAQDAGKTAMVEFLKSKGASTVNLKEAAWRAAYFGKADDLRGILDQGFDVNEKWASGTLLHTAAAEGHMEVAKLLIDRGAKLDTSLGLGTPLHDAAYEGRAEMIQYLIKRGADPNALESRNYSPLYWASANGHLEAVRVLLEHGADPNIGVSAVAEARRQGHREVVALLEQHGAKMPTTTSESGSQ
ncbi:MAG: ankyrin repeat domain-containing protein [Phycisphaerae bacterium]